MAHDREFQRKRKDTRMPVRDSHGEDQPAARQTEQDFDLRRARDTPSSVNGKTHRQDIPVQTEFSQQRTKQFPAGGFQAFFCNRGCDRP